MTKKTIVSLVGAIVFAFVGIAVYAANDTGQTLTNDASITSVEVANTEACSQDCCKDCDGNCEDCRKDCDGNCEDCDNCDKPCKGHGGRCGGHNDGGKCGGHGDGGKGCGPGSDKGCGSGGCGGGDN